jgi:hypothetical protein
MSGFSRWFRSLVVFAVSLQLASCGTILYPERKGQRDGRLDIGVVLLDGIGLLFFIIPGVIAYAVDFSNGTIYLPGGSARGGKTGVGPLGPRTVRFDVKRYSPDSLKDVLRRETGYELDWRDPRLRAVKLRDAGEIPAHFAQAAAMNQQNHE